MKENKLIPAVSVLFLLFSIPLTVFAIQAVQKPVESKVGYYHKLVDRVDIAIDATDFTFQKTDGNSGSYEISFQLSVQKCEADLYAKIDSLGITGLSYRNAEFICETPGMENAVPENLLLPSDNGSSVPLKWNVRITADLPGKGDYPAGIQLNYTSGLTLESADERQLDIPLMIHLK